MPPGRSIVGSLDGYPIYSYTERDRQVEPQPRAQGVREAQPPLRTARITDFTLPAANRFSLEHRLRDETRFVHSTIHPDGKVTFEFVDGRGQVKLETHASRVGGRDSDRPGDGSRGQRKGE